jgi:cytochrome c oxidase assembly protein subunit 15
MLLKNNVKNFKYLSFIIGGLVFLTSITGAFVAGLDAGLIYNEFPFMGEGLMPADMWTLSENGKAPWYMDILKNPSAVQFTHRVMAVSTFTAITAVWALGMRAKVLPRMSRIALHAMLGAACLQVTLGITTLLTFVPVPIAAAHQGGSLTLLSMCLWLLHTLRYIPK